MKSLRVRYLIAFLVLLLVEVFIALFVHDDFIRPYVGDILVVFVLYAFVRIIFPKKFKLLPLYIFIFAVFTEFMQLINILGILGLEDNRFLSVLVGSVFDIKDIICYGVGCIILYVINMITKK